MTSPHGWIILDKPAGLGSTQAVAAVKRNLREAGHGKVKVGHGGTLDPLAEGVLTIAVGEATKLTGRLLDATKVYEFTITFGIETDTLDSEGEETARSDHFPPLSAIAAILPEFTGEIEQVPPAFSALKVNGRRAYDLARAGEEVALKARRVRIYSLEAATGALGMGRRPVTSAFATGAGRPDPFDPSAPLELAESVTLVAAVSKGTYIRSLARDIAHALGTVGHVTMLRRTKAGPFTLDQAISLDKLNEIGNGARLEPNLLPLEAGLDDIPALDLSPEQARAVRQGRVLTGLSLKDGQYWATTGDIPVALMELAGGEARVIRGFNLSDVAE
ncbi:MAG: tRNA pseudouridine(55) synthase TruB [Sphingomonadaceae bacterium]|nr:tRNA pseudouridine(55) synthase TruB [Sphingomonadaceae bacterium]